MTCASEANKGWLFFFVAKFSGVRRPSEMQGKGVGAAPVRNTWRRTGGAFFVHVNCYRESEKEGPVRRLYILFFAARLIILHASLLSLSHANFG